MSQSIRTFVAGIATALGLLAGSPPNVVLILADDLGYGDLGSYGATDVNTPHLDQLAREGVRFTQFYSNGTECSPTRTSLFSGQYQQRIGGLECAIGVGNVGRYDDAIRLAARGQLGLPVEDNVLVRGFQERGYESTLFGKWHLGYEDHFTPRRHGFTKWFGVIGGNSDYFHYVEEDGFYALQQDDQTIQAEGYLTDLITERALAYLDSRPGEQPFFLFLPYTTPHTPIQGPNDYHPDPVERAVWNKGTREGYVEMVDSLDDSVGQILTRIDELGLANDTLVIFKSDNGGTRLARNAPFSGGKGTAWEGGIRVPCIVKWPGHLPAGQDHSQVGITMDLTRSLLRIMGDSATPLPPDGIDILAHVEADEPNFDRTLFWRGKRGDRIWRAVRDGNLKYLSLTRDDSFREHIFDLAEDPSEKSDLLPDHPDKAAHLRGLLSAWEQEVVSRR